MCITTEEVKDVIENTLFKEDSNGHTRFGNEINHHVDNLIASLVRKFWYTMAGMIALGAVAWTNLNHEIQDNTNFREAGDRFTSDDGKLLQQQIDQNRKDNESLEAWLIRIEVKLDEALDK